MTDEEVVKYARVVVRGTEVYGIVEDGSETLLFEGSHYVNAVEAADYYAWISGVTLEVE